MALKDLFKKLFKGEELDESASVKAEAPATEQKAPVSAPKSPEAPKPAAPKFEPPTSADICLPRIITVDGVDYGVDDGHIASLVDTKNFSSFRVRDELSVEKIGDDYVAFANGVEIGKFNISGFSTFACMYKHVERGVAFFKAQISEKDEEKGRIGLVFYVYTKLDPAKSMVVKLQNTTYTDFITGEYRYDNLANMTVGEEVRLVYVPKALPNGEVDHSVEELAATDLYGSNELGIISAEDEKELKARFIVTIPLICKLETLEWENEDDNSTISATIKAYDYEFNYDE